MGYRRAMAEPTNDGSLLGVAVRDIGRLRQVLTIVAQHGFGEWLARIPLAAQVLGAHAFGVDERPQGTPGERFARLLVALGPTFIKLGQVLSMRSDLLGPDTIAALVGLQDGAPPLPPEDVRDVIARGLGQSPDTLFAWFDDTPLGTASIGQTHRARTHDGRQVVVKVQRPGIGPTMRGDLDLLYLASRALEASIEELRIVAPSAIVAEFEQGLLRELDFTAELSNLVRARALLEPTRRITVPVPVPALSCRTVLVMEFFSGVPVRALTPGSARARKAIEELLHAFCKGIVVDGFFHADPHAGNLLIGDDDTICLLDLGLVGTLSPEQRDDLVTLVLGTLLDDASTVARVLLKMGTPMQRVDLGALKADISRLRAKYVVVGSVREIDTRGFVEEFSRAAGRYKVRLATEYSLLVKALATLEGLVRSLDPDVDVLPIVRPYVERVFAERWAPDRMVQQALGGATGAVSLLRTVPTHLDQILHDLETGNVQVRPITPRLDLLPDRVHDGATRIAVALFAASMSLCAAITVPERWVDPVFDSLKIGLFAVAFTAALAGWFVTWWWHWLGRGLNLRVGPLFRFFRRGRVR